MRDLISVIVPIYNVEKYIRKCIESIVNQTYKELEIILVDDGSPDNSISVCEEYQKYDKRIKIIRRENGGLSAARNTGIDAATGKYIAFVDSDDYIETDMISSLYNAIIRNNADISMCGYSFISEDGEVFSRISKVKDEILDKNSYFDKICQRENYHYVTVWNKLYKKEIWNDLRFPVGKLHEDEFVIHHLIKKCSYIVTMSKCLYWYVQRENSIMSNKISIKRFDSNEALCERSLFFKEKQQLDNLDKTLDKLLQYNEHLIRKIGKLNKAEKEHIKKINKMISDTFHVCNPKKAQKQKYRLLYPYFYVKLKRIYWIVSKILSFFINASIYRIKLLGAEHVLIDTPTHGNLGDHAIVLTQQQFLNKAGKKYVELTVEQIEKLEKYYALLTPAKKMIIIPGGGFLGELWEEEEYRVRRIIEAFKKCQIIILPQTVTYDVEKPGSYQFFLEAKQVYCKHDKLTLFVRESKSFQFVKEKMNKVNCIKEPDMVLGFDFLKQDKNKRTGILLCMRSDCEKKYTQSEVEYIKKCIKEKWKQEKIEQTDTVINQKIQPKDREEYVVNKLQEFSQAKLVITDRLHGMIFAAITGTPCIAINNGNGKVEQVYQWIKSLEYVHFIKEMQEFEELLKVIDLEKEYKYTNKFTFEKIEEMLEV